MKYRYIALAALAAGSGMASAAVTSIQALAEPSFEAPVVADGTQSDTMDGWTDSTSGSRVMDPATTNFTNQFAGNTANVPDGTQDFVLFTSSTSDHGWAYQLLQGTTDANPAVHTLTGDEAAGQTLRITFWVGRGLGANSYEDGEFHLTVGFQAQTNWNWHAKTDYTKLNDGWGDVALDLSKDEWRQVTTDLLVPENPVNGDKSLAFAFNSDGSSPDATQIHIDSVTVDVVPEPASTGLLGLACTLGLFIRRRR